MSAPDTAHLRPDKIAVWPVEGDRYGIDLSYAGATGYTRADQTHQTINPSGINATSPRTRRHVDRPPRTARARRDGPRATASRPPRPQRERDRRRRGLLLAQERQAPRPAFGEKQVRRHDPRGTCLPGRAQS